MPLRFQKRKKIAPGIRVNVGKLGVSGFTFGKRGAGITVGKRGIRANMGVPGTGLSYSTKITGGGSSRKNGKTARSGAQQTAELSPLSGAIATAIVVLVASLFFTSFGVAILIAITVGVASFFLFAKLLKIDPEVAQAKQEAQQNAPVWVTQFNENAKILKTTTEPEIFFSRYDVIVELATKLADVANAGYVNLDMTMDINVFLDEAVNKKDKQIDEFITKLYGKMLKDIEKLKTSQGKTNRIDRFFASFEPHSDRMQLENLNKLHSFKAECDRLVAGWVE